MKMAPRQWLRKAHDKLPEPRVLLAPGHIFFCQEVELDPSMPEDDVADYIALAVEGISPFPVEQLAWGYLHPEGLGTAFIFATPRSRLTVQAEEELESYFHVFPSFIAALRDEPVARPTVRFLSSGQSLTALYFAAGKRLPHKVVSRPLTAPENDDASLLAARDALAGNLSANGYDLEPGLWHIEGFIVQNQNQVFSRSRKIGAHSEAKSTLRPVELTDRQLWSADLRDDDYVKKHLRDRVLARKLWGGMRGLAAAFILLLLLQISIWGLSRFTGIIIERVAKRQQIVDEVYQRQDFIARLALDSLQSADPTLMLTLINDARPDTVYFSEAEAEEINTITVKGETRLNADTVNLYVEQLKALDVVESVAPTLQTKDSRVSFEIAITFNRPALAAYADNLKRSKKLTEDLTQTPAQPTP